MKKLTLLFCLISHFLFSQAWIQLNDIGNNVTCTVAGSPPVRNAACLSLNGKIYLFAGCGYTTFTPSSSVWEYDAINDSWCYKTDYPGNGQQGLSAFSIGNMAYVGCGYSISSNAYSDFYKYDPVTNIWTPLANIPIARSQAAGFSIGTKGYFCCGASTSMAVDLNDLWEYNVSTNNWTQKANFPDSARYQATAFSSANYGFVGLGYGSSHWFNKFYRYNPQTNTWLITAPFPGERRCGAGSVTLNNHAYILCGNKAMNVFNDCYDFNLNTQSWSTFPAFSGLNRSTIECGTIGNVLFAGGGTSAGGTSSFKDWWTLNLTVGIDEIATSVEKLTVHQIGENTIVINLNDMKLLNTHYQVYSIEGKIMLDGVLEKNETSFELCNKGLYFIKFETENCPMNKFIIR